MLGAQTVAPDNDVVYGTFGWPDVTLGYTHGVARDFDIGARMQFIYGLENTTTTQFGMAFAVPLRWTIFRHENVGLLVHVDPGIRFYTTDPFDFGFQLIPFGLTFEVRPASHIRLGLGFDFNSTLLVTGIAPPEYLFGPMVGPFFEYHVDQHLAVGLDTRFGAIIDAFSGHDVDGFHVDGGTSTSFGFRAQMMLAYRL